MKIRNQTQGAHWQDFYAHLHTHTSSSTPKLIHSSDGIGFDGDFEKKFNESCRRFSEMTLKYESKSDRHKKTISDLRLQLTQSEEHIDFLLDQIELLKKEIGEREKVML